MKLIKMLIITVLLVLITGCGTNNPSAPKAQSQGQVNKVEQNDKVKPEIAGEVKKTAGTVKGVDDSTAVVFDRNIFVAVKVSGFQRFRLQPIRKEVHEKIKLENKDYEIRVTSDKKLYKQLQQIEKTIDEGKPVSNIEERLKKINKDMQG